MRKYIAIFVLLMMIAAGISGQSAVYADSSSGKKIVTIVYDDSWSMQTGNRYSNANYAILAFIALLDEEDELYLVYMSDVQRAV